MKLTTQFGRFSRAAMLSGIVATILASTGFAGAATLDEIKASGTLNVATEDDFHPFEFVEDGKPTGYDVELLALITADAPFKVKQEMMPWAGILPGVTTGKYDIAATAVLVTDERKKTLSFVGPAAESTTYYLIKKGNDAIKSAADLNGKTVGVEAGSAMLTQFKEFNEKLKADGGAGVKEIVEYQGYPEAYQDLAIGRTDAVVNTQINLEALVMQKPDTFAVGAPVAEPTYIAWAVAKDNTALVEYLNAKLLEARKNGKMFELQKKYFGTTFESMPEAIK